MPWSSRPDSSSASVPGSAAAARPATACAGSRASHLARSRPPPCSWRPRSSWWLSRGTCSEADMLLLASLACGFVFGWGLLISGMVNPEKVLGFLDIFGAWDPSLAVVMAAALAVSSAGYLLVARRPPLLAPQCEWSSKRAIDGPLIAGSALL